MSPLLHAFTAAIILAQPPQTFPDGTGQIEVTVKDIKLEVFTYKPETYKKGPLLVVFHGVNRNADEYRDFAKILSERQGLLVIAPKFDSKRFPTAKYHNGGILQGKKEAPPEDWTWNMVPKIVDEVRKRAGRPDMPYYLIGHSAGGQFMIRMAGFVKNDAVRMVAANPGTDLFPTKEMNFPLGFGNLPGDLGSEERMKKYLAQPLTIYLGTADIVADKNFAKGPAEMKQGASRYERGKNCFAMGQKLAKDKGWTFGWRLVEAPMVAHDGKKMLDHVNCDEALGLAKK